MWIDEYDALFGLLLGQVPPAQSLDQQRDAAAQHGRTSRDPMRRIALAPSPPRIDHMTAPATGATWDEEHFEQFRHERCAENHQLRRPCHCKRCRTPDPHVPFEVTRVGLYPVQLFEDAGSEVLAERMSLDPGETRLTAEWRSEPLADLVTIWADCSTLTDDSAWAVRGRSEMHYLLPGEAHDSAFLDHFTQAQALEDLKSIWALQVDDTFGKLRRPCPPISSFGHDATDLREHARCLLEGFERES